MTDERKIDILFQQFAFGIRFCAFRSYMNLLCILRLQKEMLRKGGKDTQNTLPISSIKVKAVQCAIFIDKKRLFLPR